MIPSELGPTTSEGNDETPLLERGSGAVELRRTELLTSSMPCVREVCGGDFKPAASAIIGRFKLVHVAEYWSPLAINSAIRSALRFLLAAPLGARMLHRRSWSALSP